MNLSLSTLFNKTKNTAFRFPIAFCFAVIISIISFTSINLLATEIVKDKNILLINIVTKVLFEFFILISGILLFTLSKIYTESKKRNSSIIIYIIPSIIFFIIFYYFKLLNIFSLTLSFILIFFGLRHLIKLIPYLDEQYAPTNYWMFKNKIRENTLNVFKSVILLITFVIIINIICSHLLKFSLLSHATLLKFTCFCQFGLFNILWLAGVPNKFDEEPNKEDYKLYSTLFASNLYIIIPAILVLLFLLNIYLLKILFIKTITNSTSDNYWISIYTILTGLIGMQVFNSYEILQKNVSRYIKTFKFLFPIFYILPLGYCIYKIGNEFNTQGITFFEYIKALILISLIYPIVLLLIQKEKDTYKKYMLFFSIILLLGSFGPWGVNKLPVYSKFTALETILVKNRILENGVINKDYKNEITLPDKALVREKLRYLIQFDSIELIKPWFKNMPESVINQYKTSEVLSLNKNLFEVLFVGNENLIENILKDIGISEPTQNKNNKSQSSSGGYAGILPEDYTVYITGEGNIMNIYPVPNSKKVIFPTKNHYQGIDGCYMECYSNKKQNAVYSVAKDLYVIGQVRIKGKYNQFLVCNPNGNIKESFKLCEKYFPESCKNNYCKP